MDARLCQLASRIGDPALTPSGPPTGCSATRTSSSRCSPSSTSEVHAIVVTVPDRSGVDERVDYLSVPAPAPRVNVVHTAAPRGGIDD